MIEKLPSKGFDLYLLRYSITMIGPADGDGLDTLDYVSETCECWVVSLDLRDRSCDATTCD